MSMNMLKGIHRRMLGIGVRDEVIARSGFVAGGEDRPAIVLPGNPDVVALFDDFLGDLIADEWAFVKGDTGTVSTGALTTASGGVFRMTHEPVPLNVSGENLALTQGLFKNWKVDSGGPKNARLRMSARVKFESVSRTVKRQHVFVGFGDSGGAEFPAYDTGAGVISNATDLVGFLFSPGGDTGWSLVGCRADTDQLAVAGASYGPSANTYTTLEVEVRSGISDTGGRAHFWIDGKKVGTIDSPLTSSVALTPYIGFWVQDTGPRFLDVDYVALSQPRDTGF